MAQKLTLNSLRIFEIKVRGIPVRVCGSDAVFVDTLLSQLGIRHASTDNIRQVSKGNRRVWTLHQLRQWDQDRRRAEQNLARHIREEGHQVRFWEQSIRDYDRELRM
jgi:hypothetical protein